MKVDDDILPNIFNVKKYLLNDYKRAGIEEKVFYCHPFYYSRPVRDKNDKFYVSYTEYSGNYFNTYCSGVAYIGTNNFFNQLYNISLTHSLFWIDDAYVGLIAYHVKVDFKNIQNYFLSLKQKYNLKNKKYFLFVDDVKTNNDFKFVWSLIKYRNF